MKKTHITFATLIAISLIVLSCSAGKTERRQGNSSAIKNTLNYLATNMDAATFSPIRVGWQFDYGFREGWLLNKYEYIRSLVSYKKLQANLDYPIYVSGPHTKTALNLRSNHSFGHYNPKFVAQLHKNALEMLRKKKFIRTTKPLLEKYGILDFLKKHKSIYDITQQNPEEFNTIKTNFVAGIKDRLWPESAYRVMVPQMLDDYKYWNWSETSYHFWIRRDVDNTKDLWVSLITDVLHAYND